MQYIYIYTYMFNITTQIKIKYCKHFFAQFEVRILQTSIFVDVAIDYPHVMVHPCSHGPSYTSYKYWNNPIDRMYNPIEVTCHNQL